MNENVREAIRDKVKAIHATPSPRERADYYRLMEAYTDDLIALVREAVESSEAMAAARLYLQEWGYGEHELPDQAIAGLVGHLAAAGFAEKEVKEQGNE